MLRITLKPFSNELFYKNPPYKSWKFDFTKYLIGDLKKISSKDALKYKINYGVEIIKLNNQNLIDKQVKNGDLILKIDYQKIYDIDEVENILRKNKGQSVIFQILNQEGVVEYLEMVVNN